MTLILSGTNGLSDVDGSAATPAIRGTDTNTGIFFPAADTIGFAEGGVEAMRIDSAGNLGLGVTPSVWNTGFKALQVGAQGALWSSTSTAATWLTHNTFLNTSSSFRYLANSTASALQIDNDGAFKFYTAPSGTAGNAISFTQAMTLDASGNLGLATSSPTARLTLGLQLFSAGATNGMIRFKNDQTTADGCIQSYSVSSSTGTDIFIGNNVYVSTTGSFTRFNTGIESSFQMVSRDGNIYWGTGGTGATAVERARIDSSGRFLVGQSTYSTTTDGVALQASGSVFARSGTGNSTNINLCNGNGVVGTISTSGTSTAYNTSSDYRLKENQQPLTGSGAFIDALQPKTWNWKTDGTKGVGFIAHEVQEISPGSVTGIKDAVDEKGNPIMQGMEYGSAEFIANIIAELQSLRQRVAALESGAK